MPKFRVEKTIEATWFRVEANSSVEASLKVIGLKPDLQYATRSYARKIKGNKVASTQK